MPGAALLYHFWFVVTVGQGDHLCGTIQVVAMMGGTVEVGCG